MILWWFLGIQLAVLLVVVLLIRLGMWIAKRPTVRFWRRSAYVFLAAVPVVFLITTPAILGYLGSTMVNTRPDERSYSGPRLEANGAWLMQNRASLKRDPTDPQPGEVRIDATSLSVEQGRLRTFHVPPLDEPRFTVVMVHGLFRGALELETVGAMFRDLGGDVWLVEMRNHGRSYRGPATFGLEESRDIVEAVRQIRAEPQQQDRPLVMFGVSLGTAAVALAAEQINDLDGIVLDAPMDDLRATADRMLSGRTPRSRLGFPGWYIPLLTRSIELWSGFSMDDVRPIESLARLPTDVSVLLVGGSLDNRMPPAVVQAIGDRLPMPAGLVEVWIAPGADHGKVWEVDPKGYLARIEALVERVLAQRRK